MIFFMRLFFMIGINFKVAAGPAEAVHDGPAQTDLRDRLSQDQIQVQGIEPPDRCKQVYCCLSEIPLRG